MKNAASAMNPGKNTEVKGREGYGGTDAADAADMDEWDAMPGYDPSEDRMAVAA